MSVLPEVTQKVETDLIKVHAGIVEFDRVDFPLAHSFTPGLVERCEFLSPIHGAFTSGKRLAKQLSQSLLKEACELIAFSFPGVNAWAREKSFSAACIDDESLPYSTCQH